MPSASVSNLAGALVAGSMLATSLAVFLKSPKDTSANKAEEEDLCAIESLYPELWKNKNILEAVEESLALFNRLDPDSTGVVCADLNEIATIFTLSQTCGNPALLGKALKVQRQCLKTMKGVGLRARVECPAQASDVLDGIDTVKKAIADIVHNIQQSSALALIELY